MLHDPWRMFKQNIDSSINSHFILYSGVGNYHTKRKDELRTTGTLRNMREYRFHEK
jgi:hypothetical protein